MRTSVWTRILLFLMVAVILTACGGNSDPTETTQKSEESTGASSEATETTEATEPPADPDGNLYYNIEKGATRTPGMMDMYSVNLSCNGITKSYWFKTEELVKKADTMTVFGVGLNSTGIVTGVYTLEELGYSLAQEGLTVQTATDAEITGTDAADAAVTLAVGADMKVYSLVDTDAHIRENDVVTAVQNADKKVVAVYVTKRAPIMGMCQHCGKDVEWTMWTSGSSIPSSDGHYKLDTDVSLSTQFQLTDATTIILDLNGHTITNHGGVRCIVMFNAEGYLAIMDSSESQTGKITPGTDDVDRGSCLWVREGTVDLYSGTLDASAIVSSDSGVAVDIVTDGIFNMHGGTILGGTCVRRDDGTHGMAGSVRVRGTFNMYGGTISGGKADVGGGNVSVAASGTFKMSGGTITGGTGDISTGAATGTVAANVTITEGAAYEKTGGTIEGEG